MRERPVEATDLAPSVGIEPTTYGLEVRRSIQLSYKGPRDICRPFRLVAGLQLRAEATRAKSKRASMHTHP